MKLNDFLNKNEYNLRFSDRFVVVLKSGVTCFTLGEFYYRAWRTGEMNTQTYKYHVMCLDEDVTLKCEKKGKETLFKLYIDNEDLQAEIYLMEDSLREIE